MWRPPAYSLCILYLNQWAYQTTRPGGKVAPPSESMPNFAVRNSASILYCTFWKYLTQHCRRYRKTRIASRHVQLAVRRDDELDQLLKVNGNIPTKNRQKPSHETSLPTACTPSERPALFTPSAYTVLCYSIIIPRPLGGGIKRWCCMTSDVCLSVCLTSVCLSRTTGLSRVQRGLGRLKLAQR